MSSRWLSRACAPLEVVSITVSFPSCLWYLGLIVNAVSGSAANGRGVGFLSEVGNRCQISTLILCVAHELWSVLGFLFRLWEFVCVQSSRSKPSESYDWWRTLPNCMRSFVNFRCRRHRGRTASHEVVHSAATTFCFIVASSVTVLTGVFSTYIILGLLLVKSSRAVNPHRRRHGEKSRSCGVPLAGSSLPCC